MQSEERCCFPSINDNKNEMRRRVERHQSRLRESLASLQGGTELHGDGSLGRKESSAAMGVVA